MTCIWWDEHSRINWLLLLRFDYKRVNSSLLELSCFIVCFTFTQQAASLWDALWREVHGARTKGGLLANSSWGTKVSVQQLWRIESLKKILSSWAKTCLDSRLWDNCYCYFKPQVWNNLLYHLVKYRSQILKAIQSGHIEGERVGECKGRVPSAYRQGSTFRGQEEWKGKRVRERKRRSLKHTFP